MHSHRSYIQNGFCGRWHQEIICSFNKSWSKIINLNQELIHRIKNKNNKKKEGSPESISAQTEFELISGSTEQKLR